MGQNPMGRIDPALLDAQRDFIRVKRVDQQDQIIEEPDPDENTLEEQSKKPDLAKLSQLLLEEDQTPMGEPEPPAEQSIDLRKMSELRLNDLIDQLRATAPLVNLPESMRKSTEPAIEIDVIDMGGGGGANGGGGSGVSNREMSAAQKLLAETRLIPTAGMIPQITDKPQVSYQRRTIEEARIVNAPLNAPMIDFVSIALQGTRRMTVPEHLDNDFDYELSTFRRREKKSFFGMGGEKRFSDEPAYFRLDIRPKRSLRRL
jgi:hypothetical protein